ncbi:hypothetical protein GCM10010435_68560 [Winogradskya consettensis]|uniref:Uncharacterized protein n=1 Tax=Winogradskya consettensis TaxID=113560 RepID=A0A919VRE4_9ACTN|nr:hypothetical protein [Actinoplanes consettensis]GIM73616.1 hypothetical protein Aco04nite_36210 [Actinoplanes consettensis]
MREYQAGKGQAGLDQYQVRRWTAWHRFATLVLATLGILAICAATEEALDEGPEHPDMVR